MDGQSAAVPLDALRQFFAPIYANDVAVTEFERGFDRCCEIRPLNPHLSPFQTVRQSMRQH